MSYSTAASRAIVLPIAVEMGFSLIYNTIYRLESHFKGER